MALPKQDIRVTKTQKTLTEAMMQLLDAKPFAKITVNDICQAAMVSRSTFYLHYEDKYQLLMACLQAEREKLEQNRKNIEDPRSFLRQALETVKAREKRYRNLFMADINQELLLMFQGFFHGVFADILTECEADGATLAGPIPLLAVFYATGLSGMMFWWIKSGFQYSVEEMALCQYNLLSDITPD